MCIGSLKWRHISRALDECTIQMSDRLDVWHLSATGTSSIVASELTTNIAGVGGDLSFDSPASSLRRDFGHSSKSGAERVQQPRRLSLAHASERIVGFNYRLPDRDGTYLLESWLTGVNGARPVELLQSASFVHLWI